jgi:hypothetical protein
LEGICFCTGGKTKMSFSGGAVLRFIFVNYLPFIEKNYAFSLNFFFKFLLFGTIM